MTKQTVPEIRFKGFHGDWEEKTLGEVVLRVSQTSDNKVLPRVEYEDIISGTGVLNKDVQAKQSDKVGILFHKNDILYGKLRPYLKNWLYAKFTGIAVGDFWVLRSEDYSSKFIYSLIHTDYFQYISNQSAGSKMPRADWQLVSNAYFSFPPSLPEQEAIGALFKQLDGVIAERQKKLEQLKTLKKAMLEKMFPRNGAKVPQIRFKGFTDDWEEKTLGECIDLNSGCDYKHLCCGNIPVYGTGGYMLSVDKALSYKHDAIGIGRKGTIDKPYILKAPFWTVDTLFFSIPKKGQVLNFHFGLFQKINWRSKDESTGVPSLSKVSINNVSVRIPSLPEQEAIGNYFKTLDELIAGRQTELDKFKNMKAALLDKLFV